jgi:hypothetical protein
MKGDTLSKWYEVKATIYKTFAVEVEDSESHEDAVKYATDECGSWESLDMDCDDKGVALEDVDDLKNDATEVLELWQ